MSTLFSRSAQQYAKKAISSLAALTLLSGGFATLFTVATPHTDAYVFTQCSDSVDNDRDSKLDYPEDPDCSSRDDNSEFPSGYGGVTFTLSDNREEVAPSRSLTYTITLRTDVQPSKLVNVDLYLPTGVVFTSASDGGYVTTGRVHWDSLIVTSRLRAITVRADVSPYIEENKVLISRVMVEGEERTDTTVVKRGAIEPGNQFIADLSDGRQYVLPGEELNYTLRIRNISTLTSATDVRIIKPNSVQFVSASDDPKVDEQSINWGTLVFGPGEQKVFTFRLGVNRTTPDQSTIRVRTIIGSQQIVDQTIVNKGLPTDAQRVTISDNRLTAERGEIVTYRIRVSNQSNAVGTQTFVSAGLPMYGEFVGVNEGGIWDGTNVRWQQLLVPAHSTRELAFSIRVRPDAPIGEVLSTSVRVDNETARDTTTVVRNRSDIGYNDGNENVLIRKVADRSEVDPGGRVRYTLFVRNTLDHNMTGVDAMERFDSRYLSLVSYDNPEALTIENAGVLHWHMPDLKPGETWTTSYIMQVKPGTPYGTYIENVSTLMGGEVENIGLAQRSFTSRIAVFNGMPQTGAGMDALAGMAGAILAGAAAILHRRKFIG